MLTIEVQARTGGAPDEVRRTGHIPAVVYGHREKATSIAVDARELERVWKEAGHTSVVTLLGIGEKKETLIKDVQIHPVSGRLVHADFYTLEKGKKLQISVPLKFIGVAPAEKAGHIIVKALHEVEIEVAPADLPHQLEVDLASLSSVGDHILVSDIHLPASATLKSAPDDIVASVTAARVEAEPAPTPALDATTPESAAAPEPESKE